MTFKDPKKILRNLFDKYHEKHDNVIYANKIFIINTVINYLFKDKDYRTLDKQKIVDYGEIINRYLADEVDIFWQDGILMVRELEENDKYNGG